jgi:ribonuclease H2 subunit A
LPSFDNSYGSGYPSDPRCKDWLETNLDPVFGYPDFVTSLSSV